MGIFKKFCQAVNEFLAVPTDRTPDKPGKQAKQAKQAKQTTDLRGKKRNKKNKGQQAVPPKQAANQKFYFTGDDDGYSSIVPGAAAFALGDSLGRIHLSPSLSLIDSDIDSSSDSSSSMFQDDFLSDSMDSMGMGSTDMFSEPLHVGGFDGIIGPDSADLSEQAKWGSPIDDSFSSMDDSFSCSSFDDTFSSSIDDSFSSSFDSNSFGGHSWDD